MILSILHFILLAALLPLLGIVLYLLWFTAVSLRAPRTTAGLDATPKSEFIILIPAHNEEKLLPETLAALKRMQYPRRLYTVHVAADNCTDRTAEIVRQAGAVAHERFNQEKRGKGFALQWTLQRLWADQTPHDAVIIIDADTIVSANFLQVMDARLRRGETVVQAYYEVRDPGRSPGAGLRYAALAVLHYLRPQARMVLGGSAGLKGNGMMFAADTLKNRTWSAALTEDIEFHMELVLDGQRVMFAPDAVVAAEMPHTLEDATSQNTRWEQGRLEMAREYVPRLLKQAVTAVRRRTGRAFLLFDAAMEHLIPPFSILVAFSGLGLVLAAGLWLLDTSAGVLPALNLTIAVILFLGQAVYLFVGLRLVEAPPAIYRSLLHVPQFVAWKIWLYVRILFGRGADDWVRTTRNEESDSQ